MFNESLKNWVVAATVVIVAAVVVIVVAVVVESLVRLAKVRLGDSKPFDTIADLGSCVNLIPLNLFKKLNVGLLEETEDVLGLADETKLYPIRIVKNVEGVEIARDFKVNPLKDILVFRKMVEFLGTIPINLKRNMWESEKVIDNKIDWIGHQKEGDGAWHIRIELIDPHGEIFDRHSSIRQLGYIWLRRKPGVLRVSSMKQFLDDDLTGSFDLLLHHEQIQRSTSRKVHLLGDKQIPSVVVFEEVHMTSVKSYLHKYVEQPGPKVVFGDDSTCTTEGYGFFKMTGACQLLGGKLVCWSAKKQQSIAMSSAEVEYIAAVGCCANILWLKIQLTDYDIIYEKVPIFCDNTRDIELHFILTQYQLADSFTKTLDEPTFKRLIVELGMLNIDGSKPEPSNDSSDEG
ncbi:hypothetical protein Tco_0371019 [Tanacetum coccineum]